MSRDDNVSLDAIMQLDDIEANVERVFKAVRGLREDYSGLVIAIAQYALVWMATSVHFPDDEVTRDGAIDALIDHSMKAGKEYAKAMIAEGSIRRRVRSGPTA